MCKRRRVIERKIKKDATATKEMWIYVQWSVIIWSIRHVHYVMESLRGSLCVLSTRWSVINASSDARWNAIVSITYGYFKVLVGSLVSNASCFVAVCYVNIKLHPSASRKSSKIISIRLLHQQLGIMFPLVRCQRWCILRKSGDFGMRKGQYTGWFRCSKNPKRASFTRVGGGIQLFVCNQSLSNSEWNFVIMIHAILFVRNPKEWCVWGGGGIRCDGIISKVRSWSVVKTI